MCYGEVRYYFRLSFGEECHPLAMLSVYSEPDQELLEKTFETLYVCHYQGDAALKIIHATSIVALVATVPCFSVTPDGEVHEPDNKWFLLEKLSLEANLGENEDDEEDVQ